VEGSLVIGNNETEKWRKKPVLAQWDFRHRRRGKLVKEK